MTGLTSGQARRESSRPAERWLCAFRAAPAKAPLTGQHVLLTHSDDRGQTWSEPVAPFQPPNWNGRPGLFRTAGLTSIGGQRLVAVLCWVEHTQPHLPFFNERTEGLLDTRICLAWSDDAGDTWSAPQWVDTPFDVPTPITGPILVLGKETGTPWQGSGKTGNHDEAFSSQDSLPFDGDLACQFELNKRYDDATPWRHASVLLFSRDGGKNWPEHVLVSHDPENRLFYWDQRPTVLPDGRLIDLFWTYDRMAGRYLNIHARFSDAGGRTWSQMHDTGVPGQPAPAAALPDGRLVMVYVDRTSKPTIKLRLSEDGGRTWPQQTESSLVQQGEPVWSGHGDMKQAWAEMAGFALGLPDTATTPDGRLIVAYYAGPEADKTAIHWMALAAERDGTP